jgi:hypothetical protein
MTEPKKRKPWLLIVLVLMLLSSLACCCGCAGLWHFLPDILVQAFTEEGPLKAPVVDPDPDAAVRLERALEAGGTVRVTGEEIVQLVEPWEEEELYAFWLHVDEQDQLEFVLSAHIAELDRYVNVQARGACEIEHGWFTGFTMDQLVVSGWDIGGYMAGEQLAQHANRSMADQRAQDPNVGLAMDQIERLWLEDGAIAIELAPGGWEVWKELSSR